MSYFDMPAGAWLSGPAWHGTRWTHDDPPQATRASWRAWWTPNDPPRWRPGTGRSAGWTPNDPPGQQGVPNTHDDPPGTRRSSEWTPNDPPNSAHNATPRDPRTGSPWPWLGLDPEWTYMSPSSLLGMALRRSRSRIVQPADPRYPPTAKGSLAMRPADGNALWRWQAPFRIKAVVGELGSRFLAHDRSLWWLDAPRVGSQGGSIAAKRLVDLRTLRLSVDEFDAQIDKVVRAAVEREDRMPEILAQANDTAEFFESVTGVSLATVPRTAELLDAAQSCAIGLLMGLKHQIAARRPVEMSAQIMPVIPTPGHGSLPSGHATIAAMMAWLWSTLLASKAAQPSRAIQLDRLARRIAFNRVVAGVHFPADSIVGYHLGTTLAQSMVALAGAGGSPAPLPSSRVCVDLGEDGKTTRWELRDRGKLAGVPSQDKKPKPAPLWQQQWAAACEELRQL